MIGLHERPVALGFRLYRALVGAFPYEFRSAYREELLDVTEQAIESIWQRHGVLGLARLLADIAVRVMAEHFTEFWRDIRYALRKLAASPGFTAVAVISLSLGICIATCADSEMNGMIFRNVPGVAAPDELVALQVPTSYPRYKRYRQLDDLFSSTAAYVAPVPFGVSLDGKTDRTWGHLVTPSYFSTLGVHPALGRVFDQQEEQPGQTVTVVVSYRFWQGHLGADPAVIGKTLRINGQPATVVGVGPKGFVGASPSFFVADLWMPLAAGGGVAPELADNAMERRDLDMFHVLGRLRPGISMERAEVELDAAARKFEQDFGEGNKTDKSRRVLLVTAGKILPLRKEDVPLFTEFFLVMAGIVLLIACSNVANMMLARATGERKQIAIRLALGASRVRLIRQLLTESMLIATGAGITGFLLSAWLMHLLSRMKMPLPMPVSYDLRVDWRAFLFTLTVSLLTGLFFGILPALHATRGPVTPALKEGGTVIVYRRRRLGLRNVLLIAQLSGSLMLLVLLGLLSLGIQSSLGIQQGFNPKNLDLIALDPVRDGYSGAQAADFLQKLLERVQRLPSVTAACLTETLPVAMGGGPGVTFRTPGNDAPDSKTERWAAKYVVGKDYFSTAGIPVRLGRGFRAEDEANPATSVIVSEKFVREYWPGEDPLGRRIDVVNNEVSPGVGVMPRTFDNRPNALGRSRHVFEVVGVAGDVANDLIAKKQHPAVYFPLRRADYAQPSLSGVTLMVRSVPGADALAAVRREISAMDSNIVPFDARSMEEHIEQFMFPLRMASWTYGLIGVFGLVLAAVGLAGVTAYSVAQRTHEIGVRMALGARRANVLGLILKEGGTMIAIGTAIGMVCAWAGNRLLSGLFSTVASTTASNPVLLLGAPLLLSSLALLACVIPAHKSMQIDPATALRQE